MRRKWRRRAFGIIAVAITATLAWSAAGTPDTLNISPKILGIRQPIGTSATGTVMIGNPNATTFNGKIVGNCGVPPAIRIAGGTGDPISIASNTTLPVIVECPSTLPAGMHRCAFDIQNGSNQSVAGFFGFCVTHTQQVLTATPNPVSFVNQQVGVESAPTSLTIANPTATTVDPMQIQVDNENFLIGAPCQNQLGCDSGPLLASSSTNVSVLCKPLTAGTHTGKLFLTGQNGIALTAPVDLTCMTGAASGNAILTVSPPNISLQPIEIDGATSNATIELTNGGSAGTIDISSLEIQDDGVLGAANDWTFTVDGACMTEACALGPTQKLFVRLTFDPSGFNNRPAKLIINYSDLLGSKQASVTLTGGGLGATAELVGTPSIEFGTVPLNSPGMLQTFKLRNTGNRQTSVHLTATPMAPFIFPMDVPLDPGETTVNVGCRSSSEVDASVTLTIDGTDTGAMLSVPMHCEVRDTQLTTTPTSIPLGEIRMGTSVPAQSIIVDRVGGGMPAIPLSGAALSTTPDPNLSLGALSQMMTPATASLMITPAIDGPISNTVVITPMTGPPLPVPVTGNVVHVELDADVVMTLGTFCVGQPTGGTSVSLTSNGTATVTVTDVDLALGAASPFEIEKSQPSTYPTSLAPSGGKATVVVTPKRTDIPDDQIVDTLRWSTDAGQVTSMLTTRFVADGGAVAPDTLDFGDSEIRLVNDDAQGVTLQNCSVDPLQLLEPDVPPPFALTGEFPLLLAPAAKATFSILFLPTEVGAVDRKITIESMGGDMFEVTLRGNGVTGSGSGSGGDDAGSLDETSFYACGCHSNGSPTGVLVIAFAVLCMVRRRRRRP